MNNKSFRSLLQEQGETMAPASEISLWPTIKAHFSTHPESLLSSKGRSPNKPTNRNFAVLVTILLTIIFSAVFTSVLPQGRAFAQQVLSMFFKQVPDFRSTDQTSSSALITPTTNAQEDLTQWHVFTPSWISEGFALNRTEHRSEKAAVIQVYTYQLPYLYQRATGMQAAYFFLTQQKTSFENLWPVGESANIETVKVGDVTGEYVVGAWGGNENHQVWENNPSIQHLRWLANGYYFDLQFTIMGVQEKDYADCPYYISKDHLIAIASSLK